MRFSSQPKATLASLCIALLVVVAYLPSLGRGFVYDDFLLIVDQRVPATFGDWAGLLSRPYYEGLTYYRPLTWLTFLGQKALAGDSPTSFHFVNAILAGIVFLLARALLAARTFRIAPGAALLAAALFMLHPVASSCAYPVSGRDTLLATAFMLAAMIAFLRPGTRWALAGAAFTALGLVTKEMAAAMPLAVLWADATGVGPYERSSLRRPRPIFLRYGPLAAVLLAYVAIRVGLFSGGELTFGSLLLAPLSFLYGLQVTIAPFLDLLYEPTVAGWLSYPRLAIVAAAVTILAFGSIRLDPGRRRAAAFWAGWFVLTFLPTANLLKQETLFDERYVFLSTLGPMAVAALIASGFELRLSRALAVAAVALILVCAATGYHRGQSFEELPFYRQWVTHDPGNYRAQFNLADALAARGEIDQAEAHYRESGRLNPRYARVHNGLGTIAIRRNRTDEAIREFEAALAVKPDYAKAHNNLGNALAMTGRYEEALGHFRQAVSIDPGYGIARHNLARALLATGRVDEAISELQALLPVSPEPEKVRATLDKALLLRQVSSGGVR